MEPNNEVCGLFPPKLNGEEPDPAFALLPPPNRLPVGLGAKGELELLFPAAPLKLKVGLLSDILPCLVVEVSQCYQSGRRRVVDGQGEERRCLRRKEIRSGQDVGWQFTRALSASPVSINTCGFLLAAGRVSEKAAKP